MQNYLPACKIVSTHGVRGEMKALPLCDGAAFLAKFKRLFTTADGAGETRVLGVRAQGNVILLRLDGVNDMDAARAQVGRVYYLAKADARLPKGRFFIDDLLDCEVVDAETGRVYGRLTNVDRPAAQDIYTVTDTAGGEQERRRRRSFRMRESRQMRSVSRHRRKVVMPALSRGRQRRLSTYRRKHSDSRSSLNNSSRN